MGTWGLVYFLYSMLTEHSMLRYFRGTVFLALYCFAEHAKDCDTMNVL